MKNWDLYDFIIVGVVLLINMIINGCMLYQLVSIKRDLKEKETIIKIVPLQYKQDDIFGKEQ